MQLVKNCKTKEIDLLILADESKNSVNDFNYLHEFGFKSTKVMLKIIVFRSNHQIV
jgi:hypothetical protein